MAFVPAFYYALLYQRAEGGTLWRQERVDIEDVFA